MPDTDKPLDHSTPVAFIYGGDRQRSLDFYCGTLDFTLRSSDPHGDFIDFGPSLARLTILPDFKPSPFPMVGWNVADIAAGASRLAARGITFIRYDYLDQDELGVWTAPDGKAKVAWFNDSEGNLLSISQA